MTSPATNITWSEDSPTFGKILYSCVFIVKPVLTRDNQININITAKIESDAELLIDQMSLELISKLVTARISKFEYHHALIVSTLVEKLLNEALIMEFGPKQSPLIYFCGKILNTRQNSKCKCCKKLYTCYFSDPVICVLIDYLRNANIFLVDNSEVEV